MRGATKTAFITLGLAIAGPAFATDGLRVHRIAASGDTHVAVGPVQVDIRTRPATPTENSPPNATRCSGGSTDCSLVDMLSISVDGKAVAVPGRAVILLSDLEGARISRLAPSRFALILTGGDAGASYEARLYFDRHRIRRMEMWHGEMKRMEQATEFHDIADEAPNS